MILLSSLHLTKDAGRRIAPKCVCALSCYGLAVRFRVCLCLTLCVSLTKTKTCLDECAGATTAQYSDPNMIPRNLRFKIPPSLLTPGSQEVGLGDDTVLVEQTGLRVLLKGPTVAT